MSFTIKVTNTITRKRIIHHTQEETFKEIEKNVRQSYPIHFSPFLRQKLSDERAFIAGGYLTKYFYNKRSDFGDIDIFFRDEDSFKSVYNIVNAPSYNRKKYETDNALSFADSGITLQLIKHYFGEPLEVIEQFDLSVCQVAMDLSTKEFYYTDFFKNNYNYGIPKIHFNHKLRTPLHTFFRIMKYRNKGYTISNWDLLKASLAVASLNIKTYGDLKRELCLTISEEWRNDKLMKFLDSEGIEDEPFNLDNMLTHLKMMEFLEDGVVVEDY